MGLVLPFYMAVWYASLISTCHNACDMLHDASSTTTVQERACMHPASMRQDGSGSYA